VMGDRGGNGLLEWARHVLVPRFRSS
jgi:hypothetical protein